MAKITTEDVQFGRVKVGDKVRCIDNSNYQLTEGLDLNIVYEIDELSVNKDMLRVKGKNFNNFLYRFELIKEGDQMPPEKPEQETPRFRRSALQLEVDKQRTEDGLEAIKWSEIDKKDWEKEYKNFQQKVKAGSGMKVESAEGANEQAQKEIEKIMEEKRLPADQMLDLHKQITDSMIKGMKEELKDAVKEATAKTIPQKIVVSFKVNEKEMIEKISDPHPLLAELVNTLKSGWNVMLVGPAGSGKTTLADQASKVLGLNHGHLCFSAGVSETWLYGRQLPTGFIEAEFSRLYRDGGVFLADEMDAADANLLLSINTALANGVMYNPISGVKIPRHKDFFFVGAANTFGKGQNSAYAGRNRLDAATLDRFIPIEVEYLAEIEEKICPVKDLLDNVRALRDIIKKANGSDVISYRAFQKAISMFHRGKDVNEIKKTLTLSWSKELRQSAGIK